MNPVDGDDGSSACTSPSYLHDDSSNGGSPQRHHHRPPTATRGGRPLSVQSNASCYSCAYQLDIQQFDDMDLTQIRVPELPEYVREAFRAVARGETENLRLLLERHESLLCCINAGGQTLLEVATERGHFDCVELLKTMERELMKARVDTWPRSLSEDARYVTLGRTKKNVPPLLDQSTIKTMPSVCWEKEDDELDDDDDDDPMTKWLQSNGLTELSHAIRPLASDVADLAEMMDTDVIDLFQSNSDLRDRYEAQLRKSLVAAGASEVTLPVVLLQPTSPPAAAASTSESSNAMAASIPPPPPPRTTTTETSSVSVVSRSTPTSPPALYAAIGACGRQLAGLVFTSPQSSPTKRSS